MILGTTPGALPQYVLAVHRARCSHGPVGRAGLNAAPSGAASSPECTAVRILVRAMTHVEHGPQARGYSAAICGIGSRPHNGSAPAGLVAFWFLRQPSGLKTPKTYAKRLSNSVRSGASRKRH